MFKTLKRYQYLCYTLDDPDDQLDILNKLIFNAINEHAPLMNVSIKKQKWYMESHTSNY